MYLLDDALSALVSDRAQRLRRARARLRDARARLRFRGSRRSHPDDVGGGRGQDVPVPPEQVAADERQRLARDLHDVLGHSLTGIVVCARLAQHLADQDAQAAAVEVGRIEKLATDALAEVRATVEGWRRVLLDEELAVAAAMLASAGIDLTVDRDPQLQLTPPAEAALALALREAVTNVVRHAHASACTVTLRRAASAVLLEVRDDGVGSAGDPGWGLTGIRERVLAVGGEVDHDAACGTTLTVMVPTRG
jgi:two-component system, NarL family, sensor histidine kinase DesK